MVHDRQSARVDLREGSINAHEYIEPESVARSEGGNSDESASVEGESRIRA